jgi:hypothetical protein
LSGWPGGPGVNTFWALGFEEGDANDATLNSFGQSLGAVYSALDDLMVRSITMSWDGTVDKLNVADAALLDRIGGLDSWSNQAPVTTGNTSRATQAKLQFKTDRLRGRRFLQGGIFYGPINGTALDGDGQIAGSPRQRLADAWGGLLDVVGLNLAVYGQPTRPETPPGPGGPPNNGDGVAGYVQNVGVKRAPAVLRRRRD